MVYNNSVLALESNANCTHIMLLTIRYWLQTTQGNTALTLRITLRTYSDIGRGEPYIFFKHEHICTVHYRGALL